MGMRTGRQWLAAWLLAGIAGAGQAQIVIAGIAEARGAGTVAGTSFRNGYQLAIEEYNAAGGFQGEKLVLRQFDIDTRPEAAEAAARSAVALRPFAILGPVFSGMSLAAMPVTAPTGIPHFIGGEAASLARRFHPTLLRTSLTQQGAMPRLASLAVYGLGARRLGVLWIDNEFGRDGRAALSGAVARRGAEIGFEASVAPGQKDFAELVARLKEAPVDALVLYLNESESADALRELRRQGYERPIVGDSPLTAARTIEGAQGAAEGVFAHASISVEAPGTHMEKFVAQYRSRYGSTPDHNAVKGYFAVQVIRVGLGMAGKAAPEDFLQKIKNTRLDGRVHPNLMTTASYDGFGDLNRESYFLQVRDGRMRVMATLNAAIDTQFAEMPDGRRLVLNSNELRRELQAPGAAARAEGSELALRPRR